MSWSKVVLFFVFVRFCCCSWSVRSELYFFRDWAAERRANIHLIFKGMKLKPNTEKWFATKDEGQRKEGSAEKLKFGLSQLEVVCG